MYPMVPPPDSTTRVPPRPQRAALRLRRSFRISTKGSLESRTTRTFTSVSRPGRTCTRTRCISRPSPTITMTQRPGTRIGPNPDSSGSGQSQYSGGSIGTGSIGPSKSISPLKTSRGSPSGQIGVLRTLPPRRRRTTTDSTACVFISICVRAGNRKCGRSSSSASRGSTGTRQVPGSTSCRRLPRRDAHAPVPEAVVPVQRAKDHPMA